MKKNFLFSCGRKLGSGVRIVAAILLLANSFLPWFQAMANVVGQNDPLAVACISTTCYDTLWEAIAEAQTNAEIVLQKDIETTSAINVTKKITLNLNGKTITNSTTTAVSIWAWGDLTVNWNWTITALHYTVKDGKNVYDKDVFDVENWWNLTVTNWTFQWWGVLYVKWQNSTATINGWTFNWRRDGNSAAVHATYNGAITINWWTFAWIDWWTSSDKPQKVLYAGWNANKCERNPEVYHNRWSSWSLCWCWYHRPLRRPPPQTHSCGKR